MEHKKIFIGNSELKTIKGGITGRFVDLDGEKYYQIQNYHEMPDFLMSIVSDSDHWMFISSNGALTAGRKDRNHALFPYYTDDKIHDYKGITGSVSSFLVTRDNRTLLWEPFTEESLKFYQITRNIYKSTYGNSVVFEEINNELGLCFRYGWYNSEQFGFVKKSMIVNLGKKTTQIALLDGLRNILPYGVDYGFQNEYSNLLDAYKKNELLPDTTLGLFMLSSIPVDRAEPSEALKTTAVWSIGFGKESKILVSDKQVGKFKQGDAVEQETDIRASRGAYHIYASLDLQAQQEKSWFTVSEINLGSTEVANLKRHILQTEDLESQLMSDIRKGTGNLKKMVANADGFQVTNTPLCSARHYSNTLYNIMRGGVFANNYTVERHDFKLYVGQINKRAAKKHHLWLDSLPVQVSYTDLLAMAEKFDDADLTRITCEYLPLTFSRRHGDPSRPWNQFSIETKNEDASLKYNYQGNWRDIFQNWEALCLSYPEFIEGIISRFVNASTMDGYNPYRIMRNGFEWEVPDPHNAWSYIGYWGDHQIIYLQKLMELSHQFHPGKIDVLLNQRIFTYANIPYQIKSYDEIIENPKDTVLFNAALHERIHINVAHLGADARLLWDKSGHHTYKVNLTEKILATLLSKLSNFIPEAGIWLNTQRPEWNDANNALVGNGTSMVTLCYLRRFLKFWEELFANSTHEQVAVSEEMATFFQDIFTIFKNGVRLLTSGFTDQDRKSMTDSLGLAYEKFRKKIYAESFSGETNWLSLINISDFCTLSLKYIDQTIRVNKRTDGLYHAYNLISFHSDSISIRNLYEMLEGQVAVLSSGLLSTQESLDVLNSLKNSQIFREDQYSYMLYPNRELPRFENKNNIPADLVEQSFLLKMLIADQDTSIIKVDQTGRFHFNESFRNVEKLRLALNKLDAKTDEHPIGQEKDLILSIYEKIFDHKSFTGRSGAFYGYEGLGSIYWHMVSKLLLATQECYLKAIDEGADSSLSGQLKAHYYEIKAGIGLYKSPELYGAFPTDAYSHTPFNAGVKQPGLTGQVKEDIITRLGEMGVRVNSGRIIFNPSLLNEDEILNESHQFEYLSVEGDNLCIELNKNQIGFTYCQVPVIVTFSNEEIITIHYKNGKTNEIQGKCINIATSKQLFNRDGEIQMISVTVNKPKHVG